jgi:hypothetical protein
LAQRRLTGRSIEAASKNSKLAVPRRVGEA